MKKAIVISLVIGGLISCKSENEKPAQTESVNEQVEIPFNNEGELSFLNGENVTVKTIQIEIADTPNERARGLMDRSKMEDGNGMLFIFDDDEVRPHTFYMKNTRIPLDIMYFSPDSVLINIARNAQPGADSERSQGGTVEAAKGDSKFVVEVNGGLADQWGLKEGETKIQWTKK